MTNLTNLKIMITDILAAAVGQEYAKYILDDSSLNEVIDDIETSSAWLEDGYCNDDDIRLALGRVLLKRLRIIP